MFDFLKDTQIHGRTKESDIVRLEQKYSIVFPSVLKEFYLRYDGNPIKLCLFKVDGYPCEVADIVPMTASGLTFEKIVENDRDDGIISDDLYPIARNRGGDLYYWSTKTGRVWLLLADSIDAPFLVAEDIGSFFKLLC